MRHLKLITALLVALPMSTFVVACGDNGDTEAREALEREALERELALALEPDTTVEPELSDIPLDEPEMDESAPPRATPAPAAPRRAAPERTTPRRSEPAPEPTPEPRRPRTVSMSVPSGTTISVRMNQSLSTQNSSVGSTFTATLAEPIYSADGALLIPEGATLRGRVTESRKSGSAGQQAYLKIDFSSIAFGGESYSIDATTLDAEAKLVTRDSKTSQAAKIGGGAAAGAVLGQVIGKNTKSTIAGAAIGAAAGTAVAMGTADVDAVIPAGGRVTLRLDSPIRVERVVS